MKKTNRRNQKQFADTRHPNDPRSHPTLAKRSSRDRDDSLILAVWESNLERVKSLLDQGADVNARDEKGRNILMIALLSPDPLFPLGFSDFIETLVAAGADCKATDNEGKSVIHYACHLGVHPTLFLEHGGDINARDQEGRTPLMHAAASLGIIPILLPFVVQGLLEKGADPFAEDNRGRTVWDYVRSRPVAWVLAGKFDHRWQDKRGETVLMKLCRLIAPDLAREALEEGADPAVRNKEGKTAFMIACERVADANWFPEQLALVRILIDHGADPMDGSLNGVPVTDSVFAAEKLLTAVAAGNHKAVQHFLDREISPNVGGEQGSLLMIAAGRGDLQCVEMLLNAGADVNVVSYLARSNALVTASGQGHVDITRKLIEAGADVNAYVGRNKYEKTTNALIAASSNGHLEVVKVLIEAGADVNSLGEDKFQEYTPLRESIRHGHDEVAKHLVESGANVNLCEPLVSAVILENLEMITFLLDWGADVDPGSPLVHAVDIEAMELVELLLERGADINCWGHAEDHSGTPLMMAVLTGDRDMVEYLLQHGADPKMMNGQGESAFSMADKRRFTKIMITLRRYL
jgi:ankyrin repeat protein